MGVVQVFFEHPACTAGPAILITVPASPAQDATQYFAVIRGSGAAAKLATIIVQPPGTPVFSRVRHDYDAEPQPHISVFKHKAIDWSWEKAIEVQFAPSAVVRSGLDQQIQYLIVGLIPEPNSRSQRVLSTATRTGRGVWPSDVSAEKVAERLLERTRTDQFAAAIVFAAAVEPETQGPGLQVGPLRLLSPAGPANLKIAVEAGIAWEFDDEGERRFSSPPLIGIGSVLRQTPRPIPFFKLEANAPFGRPAAIVRRDLRSAVIVYHISLKAAAFQHLRQEYRQTREQRWTFLMQRLNSYRTDSVHEVPEPIWCYAFDNLVRSPDGRALATITPSLVGIGDIFVLVSNPRRCSVHINMPRQGLPDDAKNEGDSEDHDDPSSARSSSVGNITEAEPQPTLDAQWFIVTSEDLIAVDEMGSGIATGSFGLHELVDDITSHSTRVLTRQLLGERLLRRFAARAATAVAWYARSAFAAMTDETEILARQAASVTFALGSRSSIHEALIAPEVCHLCAAMRKDLRLTNVQFSASSTNSGLSAALWLAIVDGPVAQATAIAGWSPLRQAALLCQYVEAYRSSAGDKGKLKASLEYLKSLVNAQGP